MNKIGINSVTNANVYIEGENYLGRANEITLPELNEKMFEHKGLGMIGEVELPAGGFEKMEAKFKWNSFYPEVMRKTLTRSGIRLQIRAVVNTWTGQDFDEQPAVIVLGGVFKKNSLGNFKQHEGTMTEDTMTVHYMKVSIAGETMVEIDILNNIQKVGSVDLLARYRQLIGG